MAYLFVMDMTNVAESAGGMDGYRRIAGGWRAGGDRPFERRGNLAGRYRESGAFRLIGVQAGFDGAVMSGACKASQNLMNDNKVFNSRITKRRLERF